MTVSLTGDALRLDDVVRVARAGEPVEVAPRAAERLRAARDVVERALAEGAEVYGLTTGVGAQKRVRVPPGEAAAFNRLLILNHLVGQGDPAPEDVSRAALLRLANGLVRETSGVRPELAQRVVDALNDGAAPRIRALGSVGEADLAPMADVAHELLADFELAPNEALALLNNNAFSTGWAALAVADAARLLDACDAAAALDLEAFGANLAATEPLVARARPYAGIAATCERLGALLAGSALRDGARNLQDPLSFRCVPQVHGAARDALAFAESQLAVELNAAQGNPLVDVDSNRVVSVGNFDALPLAAALDFLRIALAPVLTSACERTVKLLQSPFSGLPEGLAARASLPHDSLIEFGVAAQALTAEARLLAQPVSYELASTTQQEGIEDRTTMAPLAARRTADMVALGERLVAVELLVAAQAVDLRAPARLGAGTARVRELVRDRVAFVGEAQPIPADLEPLRALVRSGELGRG